MKKYIFYLLLGVALLLNGCGEDEGGEEGEGTTATTTQGWHYPGRDCLACHNTDLGEDKHLLFAGTVYKDSSVVNQDDTNSTCGGELLVDILDSSFTPVYSSKDYKDSSSSGYKGKGNIFILQRKLRLISSGTYSVRITDANGTIMAVSNNTHKFTSQDYDINTPTDWNNRLSCNSCHSKSGPQNPLYIQVNKNLCQ